MFKNTSSRRLIKLRTIAYEISICRSLAQIESLSQLMGAKPNLIRARDIATLVIEISKMTRETTSQTLDRVFPSPGTQDEKSVLD